MLLFLAERPKPWQVLLLIGAVMVVVVIGGIILMVLRGKVLQQPGASTAQQGRLLDDLREALKRGEISQAEFDAAKATMAARLAGKPPPPKAPTPPGAVRIADGSLVARPGVDLTGAPLPKPPPAGGSPPGAGL